MKENDLSVPAWDTQVINFIKDIHKNEEMVKKRSGEINDLFQEDPGRWPDPKWFYIIEIMKQYFSARILFSIGFYYLSIDCCRKIIELLVRFEQNIKPDADIKNFRDRVQNELPWKKEDVKSAIEIYEIGCAAVHCQKSKIYGKSRKYSLADEVSMSRIMDEKMPEELKRFIPSIKKSLHGAFGMKGFALEVINKTVIIANNIISDNKHLISKPKT